MARAPLGGTRQRRCWQAPSPALASLPMSTLKRAHGKPKPAPDPSEEEMAVISFLFTRKPTSEESRLAVRRLLRKASKELERLR